MPIGGTQGSVFKFFQEMDGNDNTRETTQVAADLSLPPRLRRTLERLRERLWAVKIAEGALAGLIGLGLSYLLVFTLERFFATSGTLRAVLLIGGFALAAISLPLLWYRWVWKQRTLRDAARYVKRHDPRLGDELVGIVELAERRENSQSLVLIEAAMKQVDERVGERDFSAVVSTRRYTRRLILALGVLALSGLLLSLVSAAARNTLMRWVTPWRAIDRYTFAQLDAMPERLVVPYAEAFDLSPNLKDSTEWRPNRGQVKLPDHTRLSAPREEDRYHFSIPPQKEASQLALRVGDDRQRLKLEPLPRPELTSLDAVVRLPDYLRYSNDPILPVRGNTLSIVEGAVVTIQGRTNRDLASVMIDHEMASISGGSFSSNPFSIESSTSKVFSWRDIHGLEAKSSLELNLIPVPDQAPELYAHQVDAKRMILEDEVVTFDINANDDYGIRELGLEWKSASGSRDSTELIAGEKPVASGAPEKTTIQTRGTFSAAREGVPPGHYAIRAFATDFLPNRERTYSPTFSLQILSRQEHARWLTEEFSKWFRNVRESYEREQQLHESNLALRDLPSEELDHPENRRRLQDQASAELANARRVDALTSAGRGMIEEATKNPEFDAERLEKWAEMVQSLDAIARDRMPSVADLLQQSSKAPGSPVNQEDSPVDGASPGQEAPNLPSLNDREPGMTPETTSPPASEEGQAGTSAPQLLPSTTLSGNTTEDTPSEKEVITPAQKLVDKALAEQALLLDEFARVADELQQILSSLEASTFVKRLKLASRKQIEIAERLGKTLDASFGVSAQRITQQLREIGESVSEEQEAQSRFVYHILTDLEAYYQRKQDPIYKNVLDQMKEEAITSGLKRIGDEALINLNGRSIAASEFWADTLDRWAEELVEASPPSEDEGQNQQKEMKSLPPELVLRLMKVLQEEMGLRDETREMEETRASFSPDLYASKVKKLEYSQLDLRERTDGVITDILNLPNSQDFDRELQILSLASDIMRQAHAVLSRPDTGPEAVSYETEVIELLLQSKRQQSNSGGGGGSSPNSSGQAGGGNGSALSDIGPQATPVEGATPGSREVDQSTGKAGRELPEEFRRGLDHYFNELESN